MRFLAVAMVMMVSLVASAQEPKDLDPGQNLALGKRVTFCPAPNYRLTDKGGTDASDLTDGKLTQREDLKIWFDSTAVGWSYGGRVNLSVDLGAPAPIDEVAIRLLGGSPQAAIAMPGWVEVLVSEGPGEPYYKVAEYSRWQDDARQKYEIPRSEGTAWIHRLRFSDLQTRGRLVGVRFYGTGVSCSDELYVMRGQHDLAEARTPEGPPDNFTVTGPQIYFHKPVVHVTGNIVTPVPVGCAAIPRESEAEMTVRIAVPKGIEILGGSIRRVGIDEADVEEDPQAKRTRYTWRLSTKDPADKVFGRLYMTGRPEDGGPTDLVCSLEWGKDKGPELRIPIEVLDVPPQPVIPKRLMTSLSWWSLEGTRGWPRWQEAFQHIGLNTVPVFGGWLDPEDTEAIGFVSAVRDAGYRIQVIDSTWHRMLSRNPDESEFYCQFGDESHGSKLCPSYRGHLYRQELKRVATVVKLVKPGVLTCDIELWGWRGPTDAPNCTRCQADKVASGIETWEAWQLAKGEEMCKDLHAAVQEAVASSGGPPCEMGVYDFRPGKDYNFFWPFDRLYPEYLQSSQVSTYTPLDPDHIEMVGDEIRHDRSLLPKNDQLPWITPGDAGTFPGDSFYHALLECFCNGSRGVNFWSSRVWDAELLVSYARAIRAIAPVEDIIVDGKPLLPEIDGAGRVSGMALNDEIVLLVADYHGESSGEVAVRLDLEKPSRVTDLDTKQVLVQLEKGPQVLRVPLEGARARILHIRTATTDERR